MSRPPRGGVGRPDYARGRGAREATRSADALDFKEIMRNHEASVIEGALEACSGNQTEAARRLKMPLRTFVHKLKTLGIRRNSN